MKMRQTFAGLLLFASSFANAADESRTLLAEQIKAEAEEFCSSMYEAPSVLPPAAIKPASRAKSRHPDLIVQYRAIQCVGVDGAAMEEGGFCTPTVEGMKCEVRRFAYRHGRYMEADAWME